MLLTACSSPYRATTSTPLLPESARVAPVAPAANSLATSGATFGRIGVKSLSCAQLTAEDRRLTAIGMAPRPTRAQMLAQQRLLDVRNARFTRCNAPAGTGQNRYRPPVLPKNAVAFPELPAASPLPVAITYQKQMAALTAGSMPPPIIEAAAAMVPVSPVSVSPAPVPPAIEIKNISESQTGFQAAPGLHIPSSASPSSRVKAEQYAGRQFKTIIADGDDVRVTTVSYGDLPLVSGTEPELR